ncbi:EF-hand calcium-binding domain-containing protein 6 [Nephila pilipes]|uniref:EF-hand calcium-binding domain-containing protein 6 n=1 Tax=Nephila pilipes TaxID=299642 RepID=A0A8X6NHB2_NEPPI|nr:EF-hand calcium-binding domain-containing protein 6 [Nephila pilipes]
MTMLLSSEESKNFKNKSSANKDKITSSEMENNHESSKSVDLSTDISSISSFTHHSKSEEKPSNIKYIISEKLNCSLSDIVQALKTFDKQRNGKILSANLHNVLNIFCHPLTAKEFNELLRKESVDEYGFVDYKSFLLKLTNKANELKDAYQNKENEFYKKDPKIEEIEVKMKSKIGRNLKNFIRSMWLYDFNHDGLIQKHEFRNILENYCFCLTDDQYNRLWSLYDPAGRGVLNYKDFLLKLGARSESYKRIMPKDLQFKPSSTSFNVTYSRDEQVKKRCAKLGRDDPAIQGQVLNYVIDTFKKKIEKNFPILLRTFQIKDGSGSGSIPITVFHQVLNYFVMPMSSQLFKQVLMSFDIPPTANKIEWYEFLKNVCTKNKVENQSNTSHLEGSHNWQVCKTIMEKLRKNSKDPENFFKNSFTISSQNKKIIPRAELRRTINQYLTFPIAEEEFRSLMFILDSGHSNMIDCDKFLSLLTESSTVKNNGMSKQSSSEEIHPGNAFAQLSGEKFKKEFRKCFNKNLKNIEKAINAFDAEETGFMLPCDLKKILESFCFPLTDSQCCEIFSSFPTFNNKVFYSDFINHYKKTPYEDEEKWAVCVKRLTAAQDATAKRLSNKEILRNVKETVRAQKEIFLKEFKNYDYCSAGIARKEVFLKLINKYVCRLTDEQLNMLWNMLPVNEIGLLKYEVFLNDYIKDNNVHSTCDKSSISSHVSSPVPSISSKKSSHSENGVKNRPKTAGSVSSIVSSNSYNKLVIRPKSAVTKHSWEQQSILNSESIRNKNVSNLVVEGQGCSVLTSEQYKQYRSLNFGNVKVHSELNNINGNAKINIHTSKNFYLKKQENVCNDLKKNTAIKDGYSNYDKMFIDSIKSRWRDILRRCKAKDPENTNKISWNDFENILPKTGITINDVILDLLETEYNIKRDIQVNYWTFLRKILLALDSKKKVNVSKVTSSQESVSLCKVLLTNRDKILKNYRDLRYAFRRADQQHSGSIRASEFRRIMALHRIHLSEDDFFYICDYFDPKLTEKIPYDDFLEAFIQK